MIELKELERRVKARKCAIDEEEVKLSELKTKISDFIFDVKGRSVIYNLIKNLPLWKVIEQLIIDQ